MAGEKKQYFKDSIKRWVHDRMSGEEKKLKSPMVTVMMQLKAKGLLPASIRAIEIFGMHGLWHTRDYAPYIHSLDIFEINEVYHRLSKKALKKFKVNYFHADSLKFISETDKKYNFIVSDTPYGGSFNDETGLPKFFNDLLRVSEPGSVFIVNIHTEKLKHFEAIKAEVVKRCAGRTLADLFFETRNSQVSYLVFVLR